MGNQGSERHACARGLTIRLSQERTLAVWVLVALALIGMPPRVTAQTGATCAPTHPEYRLLLDAPLLAAGATLLVVGSQLDVTRKFVPPEGLDRSDIHWSLDRNIIGERSVRADRDSDIFRDLAFAYPAILTFVSQPSGDRWRGSFQHLLEYAEAMLIAEGMSSVIKRWADRPRPFTYLPEGERPNNSAYNVTSDEAFESMPSGHAAMSFCSASFTIADHLLARPQASGLERAAVAFVGGYLAGMTVGMRLEGGQHFPSDTMVGALIGTTCGVATPMVHHYIGAGCKLSALPPARIWWHALAFEVIGIGAGIASTSWIY